MKSFKLITVALLAMLGATLGNVAVAQNGPALAPTLAPAVTPSTAPAPAKLPVPAGAHELTAADVDAWLDGYMPYALHTGDLAGAVVMVVKDGKVLTGRGYGYADIARKIPVDPQRTLFRPGSVSKLVTWTAVIQLVDAGKLDLDADVNTYLDFKIPPFEGKPVTLRQIMTHTAGFEEAAKDIIFFDPKHIISLEALVKRWTPTRIFAPGTTPAYSNWATTLAAYIVQRRSGMPFDDYLEQNIFAPLGMRDSTFRQPLPDALKAQMATGYPRASVAPEGVEIIGPGPAGALASSGADMAKFMIAHLQGGELDGKRILSPRAAELMHNTPLTLLPPLNRMELGFFETNINGREVIGHLGDTQNFHTSLHLFMREGVGFYVSFNSAGKEGAAGTLRNALFQDFSDRYFPGGGPEGRVDAKTAAEHAKLMAGNWSNSRQSFDNFLNITTLVGQSSVSTNDKGQLVVSNLTGQNGLPRTWVEIAPFLWRDTGSHDRLAAKVNDGKVVRWSMDEISPFMVFDRVPFSRSATWLLPALGASIGVLALTFLYWPGAWFVRRRYGSPLAVTGAARKAYRATRIMAGLVVAVVIGWCALISVLINDAAMLTDAADKWLWLLQILGAIVFVGAIAIAAWNVWLTWRDGRGWTRKLWSVLILLSAILVLHVAHSFGLLAMTVNF